MTTTWTNNINEMMTRIGILLSPSIFKREIMKLFYIPFYRFLLKLNGVEYGDNLCIYNKLYFLKHRNSKCVIGNNFLFTSGDCINPLSRNLYGSIYIAREACLTISNNVGLSSCVLWCSKSIDIGENVKIGSGTILLDTDCHSINYISRRTANEDFLETKSKPIVIHQDVLIGANCIILKGVTIGARSIIGAGAVVTKDIPEDCVAAGNPCSVIKFL